MSYSPSVQGRGGRHSRSGKTAVLFGATGFLGRYVVNALGRKGWTIHLGVRGDDMEWRHLKPLCDHGKLVAKYYSAKDVESVKKVFPQNVDVVVNMIGKRYETKHFLPWIINNTFEDTHVLAARTVAREARRAGAKHLVHVSCARAEGNSSSVWAKTKAQGEVESKKEFPGATIVKAGQMYGEEDSFLNTIATWGKLMPAVYPLLGNGEAKLSPVFVGDVARAVYEIMGDWDTFSGETVSLVGKDEYTLRQLTEFVHSTIGVRNKMLINVDKSNPLLKIVATALNALPNPILTPDQVQQWCCSDALPKANELSWDAVKIQPAKFDKKAYTFLYRYRAGGHFEELREVEKVTSGIAHVSHQVGATSAGLAASHQEAVVSKQGV